MNADRGSSDIAKALQTVYNSLPTPITRPLSIFLLTDGSIWDVKDCVAKTEKAISTRASDKNFMRVFTIGLGAGVSTDMCDSIARAGGGISIYIVSPDEPYLGKCARLVQAARTPPISDVKISWTDDSSTGPDPNPPNFASGPVSLFEDDFEYSTDDIGVPPPPTVQQAPMVIQSLMPRTRAEIYAIIEKSRTTSKSFLNISCSMKATGETFKLRPVLIQELAPTVRTPTPLHTLAAKAIITERESGHANFPDAKPGAFTDADKQAFLKTDIVRLGTAYNLTSRYTSFLAVDKYVGRVVGSSDNGRGSSVPPPGQPASRQPQHFYFTNFSAAPSPFMNFAVMHAAPPPPQAQTMPPAPTDIDLYDLISRTQQFDGSFPADFKATLDTVFGSTAQPVFEKYGVGGNAGLAAAVMAWVWMEVCGGDEMLGMREKTETWLREHADKVNIKMLQEELRAGVTFFGGEKA